MPAQMSKQWMIDKKVPVIPDATPIRIMQFGEGGFLRAFVDWIFKRLNDSGLFQGTVRVVQPIEQGMVERLGKQGYVYSLVLRGMENGKVMDEPSFIDVIRDGLNPYTEWKRFIDCACEADLRYVVSNTTEAGIVYVKTDKPTDACPQSYPAKVAAMLAARYDKFGGAADKGLLFLPCELIEANGTKLREAIIKHLADWGLEATVGAWVNAHCRFYNTLVDRIVSGYPRGAGEAEKIWEKLDCKDDMLDVGEYFHLWVVEGDLSITDEIPFQKTGLNVVVTDNLKPYRDRKVRVLNGAHTGNVLGAYLSGIDTVSEMMADEKFGANLRTMVMEEILPGVKLPDDDKRKYAEAVFERFQNPFVRHELISISLNSVSKWKVRVLVSLKDYIAQKKAIPQKIAFSLAALMAFYRGKWEGDKFVGTREKGTYTISDDKFVLEAFDAAWTAHAADPMALAKQIMADERLWGEDLTKIDGLADSVGAALADITAKGPRAALRV